MTKDEALDLALEALTYIHAETSTEEDELIDKAITAIKAALEAKDEPVWCGHCNGSGRMVRDPDIGTDQECFVCDGAGVPAAPVQEPVAWISPTELLVMRGNALGGAKDWRVNVGLKPEDGDVGLYTTPPQRTWVGLTDEEVTWLCNTVKSHEQTWGMFVRAIEAKLKENNT